jgi:hypothetical protein
MALLPHHASAACCLVPAAAGDGPLKLILPLRFGDATWMAACWKVLSEAGPQGLTVPEVRWLPQQQLGLHLLPP